MVLAAAAMALFVAIAIAERRQELATMAALGASLRRIGAFVWSEAGARAGRRARSWPPGSAGCSPRCSSRCSRTSSTRRRTTSRSPGGSWPRSAGPPPWSMLVASLLARRLLGRLPLGAILREHEASSPAEHTEAMPAPRVLVVEDDAELRRSPPARPRRGGLRGPGRGPRRRRAGRRAREESPDVLVIDIGLPDADGRDVCQALRAQGVSAPVLFLTARDAHHRPPRRASAPEATTT